MVEGNSKKSIICTGLLFIVLAVPIVVAFGFPILGSGTQPGSLKTSFGSGGRVWTDFGTDVDQANDIAVQPDEKILAVGVTCPTCRSGNFSTSDFALARYNPDGSLDATFGTGGLVTTDFTGTRDEAYAVALRGDGKIIVAGSTFPSGGGVEFAVARYNSNGSLDSTFDSDGKVSTSFESAFSTGSARAVDIYPGNRIVVAGEALGADGTSDFAIARYNPNGSLDTAFDDDGLVVIPNPNPGTSGDNIEAVAVYSDTKVLAAGTTSAGSSVSDFMLLRLNSDGSPDTSFDSDGFVITDFGAVEKAFDMALYMRGPSAGSPKIMVAGQTAESDGSSRLFAVARYHSNGALDNTFSLDGMTTTDFGLANNYATSIFVQPGHGILVAGGTQDSPGTDFAIARYSDIGNLDPTFGTGGLVTTGFDLNDSVNAVALTTDGSVIVAGEVGNFSNFDFGLACYNNVLIRGVVSDFDGDGRTDKSVFRGTDGVWYVSNSSDSTTSGVSFGLSTDLPVPEDYDGDTVTDFAVFRPSTATWFVLRSSQGFSVFPFGLTGDIPVQADYDGDGKADMAVFRPSDNTWYINGSSDGFRAQQFGLSTDIPVPGDFDGDGKADIAVFRPNNGVWYISQSSSGVVRIDSFGLNGDMPVHSDYDGDRVTDLAVFRPSDQNWYVHNSSNGSVTVDHFGISTDIPVPGDYDGDGMTDIGVFRPGTGDWWTLQTTNGLDLFNFGLAGDIPIPRAYYR